MVTGQSNHSTSQTRPDLALLSGHVKVVHASLLYAIAIGYIHKKKNLSSVGKCPSLRHGSFNLIFHILKLLCIYAMVVDYSSSKIWQVAAGD